MGSPRWLQAVWEFHTEEESHSGGDTATIQRGTESLKKKKLEVEAMFRNFTFCLDLSKYILGSPSQLALHELQFSSQPPDS